MEEIRTAALRCADDNRFPFSNAIDMLRKAPRDLGDFILPAVYARHATHSAHTHRIKRVRIYAMSSMLLEYSLNAPSKYWATDTDAWPPFVIWIASTLWRLVSPYSLPLLDVVAIAQHP